MTKTSKNLLIDSAVSHRTKTIEANLGLEIDALEGAKLLGIPIGTLSAWKSHGEATFTDSGELVLDNLLRERVSRYRRPLRTDVEIRTGARSREHPTSKLHPADPVEGTLFGPPSGDGSNAEPPMARISKSIEKFSDASVGFQTAIMLLSEKASALRSELNRVEDEIRRLESVTV